MNKTVPKSKTRVKVVRKHLKITVYIENKIKHSFCFFDVFDVFQKYRFLSLPDWAGSNGCWNQKWIKRSQNRENAPEWCANIMKSRFTSIKNNKTVFDLLTSKNVQRRHKTSKDGKRRHKTSQNVRRRQNTAKDVTNKVKLKLHKKLINRWHKAIINI